MTPVELAAAYEDLMSFPDADPFFLCPSCGSDHTGTGSLSAADSNLGDCDWKECYECSHRWDIG